MLCIYKISEAIISLLVSLKSYFMYFYVDFAEEALVNKIKGTISLVLTLIEPFSAREKEELS